MDGTPAPRTHSPRSRTCAEPLAPSSPAPRAAVDLEVVVPAFNEEHRLPATLAALAGALGRLPLQASVVVVDNGSSDRTAALVREWAGQSLDVALVGCSRQGKGAAVRRGVLTSRARWVGFCDADLATSLDALPRVVAALTEGASVVIGSRRVPQAELAVPQHALRRVGGSGFRLLARRLAPGVTDTQCGFKFFSGPVGRALFADCRCDGFAFDVEVLARALRAGLEVVEVPVSWRSRPGSTFSVLHDGHRAAQELVRIRTSLRAEAVGRRGAPSSTAPASVLAAGGPARGVPAQPMRDLGGPDPVVERGDGPASAVPARPHGLVAAADR